MRTDFGEAPFDSYHNRDHEQDDNRIVQMHADYMWSRWPDLARALGIESPSLGEGREGEGDCD